MIGVALTDAEGTADFGVRFFRRNDLIERDLAG